ncbi:MAG: hypothetical protein J6I37_02180 [Prevotella sp.]|nr:hypothetical protein [Prevotella sp.]
MLDFIHRYEAKIEISTIGHDLSLDFVKGICILLVLFHHTTDEVFHQDSFFYIWGYPAVPLFLLIQVFHSLKYGYAKKGLNLMKIWNRAVLPFLIAEVLIFICYLILNPSYSWKFKFIDALYWGGKGPGSYYPWIYIQFALLLPLLRPLFRRMGNIQLAVLFLFLSVGCEVVCSIVQMPEWVFRLLLFRYIFLFYLGYEMVEKGIVMNIVTVFLSMVSLVALYFFEVKGVDWSPWFYHSEGWNAFHWICYFYMAYPLLFLLCKFFYWLPANSVVENIVCKVGIHSYAIYIFQLFYFVNIAPYIKEQLVLLGNPSVARFLYVLLAVLICTIPVIRFVNDISNREILRKVVLGIFLIVGGVLLVTWKWRPYYRAVEQFTPYEVAVHNDDSLRVIMLGDSWVYFHETLRRDSTFEQMLKRNLGSRKVKVLARGRYGFTSGQTYERMSAERCMEIDYDLNYCSQDVVETGPDYCVISVGINDARQRRGKDYYVRNYVHMLRLLLSQNIIPVVMEIPDVDVDEAFDGNTLYYQLKARICMSLLETSLRGVKDYRQALKDSLVVHHLMDSIVYIPAASWNPEGWRDKRNIYTDDHFHLNLVGYDLLDSTFAAAIVRDYRLRKKR